MDPISLWLVLAAGMWVFDNDEQQNTIIENQQAQIEQMDKMLLRLTGSHAATSARDLTNDDELKKQIERLENEINYLDDKIDIMTDPARMVE